MEVNGIVWRNKGKESLCDIKTPPDSCVRGRKLYRELPLILKLQVMAQMFRYVSKCSENPVIARVSGFLALHIVLNHNGTF